MTLSSVLFYVNATSFDLDVTLEHCPESSSLNMEIQYIQYSTELSGNASTFPSKLIPSFNLLQLVPPIPCHLPLIPVPPDRVLLEARVHLEHLFPLTIGDLVLVAQDEVGRRRIFASPGLLGPRGQPYEDDCPITCEVDLPAACKVWRSRWIFEVEFRRGVGEFVAAIVWDVVLRV